MTQQRSLVKIRGLEYNVNKLQDNISAVLEPVLTNPINFGIIVRDIVLPGSADVSINHLLARQPQGWFVIDTNASDFPYRVKWDAKTITFNSAGPVTVSIYIF